MRSAEGPFVALTAHKWLTSANPITNPFVKRSMRRMDSHCLDTVITLSAYARYTRTPWSFASSSMRARASCTRLISVKIRVIGP
jgi:hypothetical protein